jgi:hypothetical protein
MLAEKLYGQHGPRCAGASGKNSDPKPTEEIKTSESVRRQSGANSAPLLSLMTIGESTQTAHVRGFVRKWRAVRYSNRHIFDRDNREAQA